ncbi:MAG: MarR family winged helix-turn-helix transcriptional regulator [Candidatus Hydrogenedentes bacterium]|nr:MarR family winged helix-turn-helix transcriptional regulator [Candidatus Hydrogenedentota bacterium]
MSETPVELNEAKCAEAANSCVCFNLRKASRAVTKLFDEALQPTGLRSTQFVTLLAVHLHQSIGLPALAKELVIDRSTLTRNLAVLQKNDLVESNSPNGKRSRVFQLTNEGCMALSMGLPLWEKTQNNFVTHFGAEKWENTLSFLSEATNTAQRL